ncbi:hypothetical protein P9112_007750 [Eukaryota sp. TZLM1-RC]
MENQRAHKPTVITVDLRESTSVARYPSVPTRCRYPTLPIYNILVEKPSPNKWKRLRCTYHDSDREAIKALTQEVAALKSKLSLAEKSKLNTEESSESTPVSTETRKPRPSFNPRDFKLPSVLAYEDSQDQTSDSSNTTNVATFEKCRLVSENQLHQPMLPYVLCTITPVVLETFEIFEGIDPNDPEAILYHLLSFCRFEDSAEAYHKLQSLKLNLSAPTAEEAITSYISAFLKKLQLCPSELPEAARMKFFVNGIRPKRLRFIIRNYVRKLAPPTSVPELRFFIGSINFLRDWLPSNKPKRIKLGPQVLQCFNNIKEMVINSLSLSLPDTDSTILVSTDASDKAIAGIIWKELEPSSQEPAFQNAR